MSFLNLEFLYFKAYQLLVGDWSWLFVKLKALGVIIMVGLSLLVPIFLFGIIRVYRRLSKLNREQKIIADHSLTTNIPPPNANRQHWDRICEQIASSESSDWKLAVLEADAMLDEMIAGLYPHFGDNLGERLKKIEPSDFPDLDKAWEAHKVRNRIAHEPNYDLSAREARRAIQYYQRIFEDFRYI